MREFVTPPTSEGHPIRVLELQAGEAGSGSLEDIYEGRCSGLVLRGVLPEALCAAAVERMGGADLADEWASPNKGMPGGELRVIGEAATPTFTYLQGPPPEVYRAGAVRHAEQMAKVFEEDPLPYVKAALRGLNAGRPAAPPRYDEALSWSPYTVRALDPGVQIYAHHDNHYHLKVYGHMSRALRRETIMSWVLVLQRPESGGDLIAYGLWGSDPNPPMLPTRFLDVEALEARFDRHAFDAGPGDLIIFDSGRHVHRVSPAEGSRPRVTMGGFMSLGVDGDVGFWS